MDRIHMLCPAKVNRTLCIGEKQKNGLHEIESEMQKIALFDELTIAKTKSGGTVFQLENPKRFEVPDDGSNIVLQAIRLFFEEEEPDISIILKKRIPAFAGLGGGSSDAAGTLLCLQKLFPEKQCDIFHLGKTLGSDVSFFLGASNRAMIRGTGGMVIPMPDQGLEWMNIIKPKNVHVSTAWAYEAWDRYGGKNEGNDFESVVFSEFPIIHDIAKTLQKSGAKEVRLCGSGSSVYGIFQSQKEAAIVAKNIDGKKYWKWTGKTCGKH